MQLFDDLFVKASDLQTALISAPGKRNSKQIDLISQNLNLVPFFRELSKTQIADLAAAIGKLSIDSSLKNFFIKLNCIVFYNIRYCYCFPYYIRISNDSFGF